MSDNIIQSLAKIVGEDNTQWQRYATREDQSYEIVDSTGKQHIVPMTVLYKVMYPDLVPEHSPKQPQARRKSRT